MKNSREILDELASISTFLANVPRHNVFEVPEGYFDAYSESLMQLLKAESILPDIKTEIHSIPEGYFETLPDQILNRIHFSNHTAASSAEEIATISPMLAAIGNRQVFEVPNDYFEQNEKDIIASVRPVAKLVRMGTAKKIFKYAAAAVVATFITYASVQIFNRPNQPSTLAQNGINKQVMADAQKIIENNSFEQALANISDQEITSYLENSGLDVEAALVASVIESDALPDPEAYLFDENTLNEFLTEQNIKPQQQF